MQCQAKFLSTLSLRRATLVVAFMTCPPPDFYPRSPCGERLGCFGRSAVNPPYFYPRSPCGERRSVDCSCHSVRPISIHALLAESDHETTPCKVWEIQISIHALLAESDLIILIASCGCNSISIHALLAESDIFYANNMRWHFKFLSTLSLRRATTHILAGMQVQTYFYPRSPCGERLHGIGMQSTATNFYPRSPCGERRQWL